MTVSFPNSNKSLLLVRLLTALLAVTLFATCADAQDNTTTTTTTTTTPAATAATTTANINDCSKLKTGDVFIYSVFADDPNGVGFQPLVSIPAGLELYMTDEAYLGGGNFSTNPNEGIKKLIVPEGGFAYGQSFGYGYDLGKNTPNWTTEFGNFNVGVSGDSVILYCILDDGSFNFLVGFTNNNEWMEPFLDETEYGAEGSALPEQFFNTVGAVALPHFDSYVYKGPEGAVELDELQQRMMDPANWEGSDDGLGDQASTPSSAVTVVPGASMLYSTIAVWTFCVAIALL